MVSVVRNSLLTASLLVCVVVVILLFNLVLTQLDAFEFGVPPPSFASPYLWFMAQGIVLIPLGDYFLVGSTGMLAGAALFMLVARWRVPKEA